MPAKKSKDKHQLISKFVQDSSWVRRDIEPKWEEARLLDRGEHEQVIPTSKKSPSVKVDRIKSVMGIHAGVITERLPEIEHEPRPGTMPEKGFIDARYANQIAQLGIPLTPGQYAGNEELDQTAIDAIRSMGVPDEFLFIIDKDSQAAWANRQTAYDLDAMDFESFFRELVYGNLLYGHQDYYTRYDDQDNCVKFENLNPYNCWIARESTRIQNADHFVYLEIIDLESAKQRWPDIPDSDWDQIAVENPESHDTPYRSTDPQGIWRTTGSGRKWVNHWVAWIRDSETDVTESEEIDEFDEFGLERTVSQTSTRRERVPLRQLELLGEYEIYDGPSDYSDIPIGRATNWPIPQTAYGEGEPNRLKDIQHLRNRIAQMITESVRIQAWPERFMPDAVYQKYKDVVETIHSDPGRVIPVDAIDWMNFTSMSGSEALVRQMDPPQLSAALEQILNWLDREMEHIGGIADVLRGSAKSDWSNALAETLGDNAKGVIGFKARSLSTSLKRQAKIALELHLKFTPASVFAERDKSYPEHVHEAFRQSLLESGFSVKATVSGSGVRESKIRSVEFLANTGMLQQSQELMRQALEILGVENVRTVLDQISTTQQLQASPIPEEEGQAPNSPEGDGQA